MIELDGEMISGTSEQFAAYYKAKAEAENAERDLRYQLAKEVVACIGKLTFEECEERLRKCGIMTLNTIIRTLKKA